MPTVIFDADSTIFSIETLDQLSIPILKSNPDKLAKIHELTNLGMQGKIDFYQSLKKRLDILQLNKANIKPFASTLHNYITHGFKELVQDLKARNIDLWVLSGGLLEVIQPVLLSLGFDQDKIHGSGVNWDKNGDYMSLSDDYPLNYTKVEALKISNWHNNWDRPRIMIGDGFTDLKLYQEHMVDNMIVYTEHAARDNVIASAPYRAHNILELKRILDELLNKNNL